MTQQTIDNSRCKTGWSIEKIPFGARRWSAYHPRGLTYNCATWERAFDRVVEDTTLMSMRADAGSNRSDLS